MRERRTAEGEPVLGSFIRSPKDFCAGLIYPLAQVALEFGPPDYFSLMVLGLVAAVVPSRLSQWRSC